VIDLCLSHVKLDAHSEIRSRHLPALLLALLTDTALYAHTCALDDVCAVMDVCRRLLAHVRKAVQVC
jgi:hypothetical protein